MEMTIVEQLVGWDWLQPIGLNNLTEKNRKQERVALKTEKKKQHRLQVERQREQRAR